MDWITELSRPCYQEAETKVNQLGNGKFQVIDLESGKNFCIGTCEYSILQLCNGRNTISEIAQKNEFGLNENDICRFVVQAAKIGLITTTQMEKKQKQNIFSLRLPLVRLSETFLCRKKTAQILKGCLYVCCALAMIYIAYEVKEDAAGLFSLLTTTNYLKLHNLLFYFLSFFMLAFVHENAHAVVLASYGVLPGRMGVMLNYFHPSCYVEVTGVRKVKSKFGRIQVWLAGVVSQTVIFALSLFFILHGKHNTVLSDFFQVCCLVNFALIFFNLFYVIKLDGYHILCELFENHALREDALSYITGVKKTNGISDKKLFIYVIVGGISIIYLPIFVISVLTNMLGFFIENANQYIDIAFLTVICAGAVFLMLRRVLPERRRGN